MLLNTYNHITNEILSNYKKELTAPAHLNKPWSNKTYLQGQMDMAVWIIKKLNATEGHKLSQAINEILLGSNDNDEGTPTK